MIEQLRKSEVPRGIVGNSDVARELASKRRKSTTPVNLFHRVNLHHRVESERPINESIGVMNRLYFNPRQPGSFGGLPVVERYVKGDVKSWLIRQDAYTLHKPLRHRFRRRQTFIKDIHDLWQTDLVDMKSLSNCNDGVKFLITCIDTFSKYAWVRPLKNKYGQSVTEPFQSILNDEIPLMLQSDKGIEYKNVQFQSMLKEYDIRFYTSENDDIKAAIVERFNRTLKTRMYRYFIH